MTAKEIAEKSGVKLWKIYYVAEKLGRLPTIEEAKTYKGKKGRPPKHFKEQGMEKVLQIKLVGTIEQVCQEIKMLIYYYGGNAKLSEVIRKEIKIKYVNM